MNNSVMQKMDKNTVEKIERLKKQQSVLRARIQQMENKARTTERKLDTRRKILVGSYFLQKYKDDNNLDDLVKIMHSFLTRESDRNIFNLGAKHDQTKETK